jgi:membrane-associated phospholipid phosphatase
MSYWVSIAGLHASRTPRTLELMAAATRLAILVEMRFKHAFAVPRPVQFSPQVQPPIQTPSHSSFPSGHSTEAHCAAEVLMAVSRQHAATPVGQMLLRQAGRMAINRTVAGVHFPIDSRAGQVLGTCLAEYLCSRATGSWPFRHRAFEAADCMEQDYLGYPAVDLRTEQLPLGLTVGKTSTATRSPALSWLWEEAQQEWR